MSKYRVGLIGLGQIAAGYGSPGEAAPYCHAGGLAQSDKVQLVAAADAKASGDWTVVTRDDGSRQWAYKGKPVYTYKADQKAGDLGDDALGQDAAHLPVVHVPADGDHSRCTRIPRSRPLELVGLSPRIAITLAREG